MSSQILKTKEDVFQFTKESSSDFFGSIFREAVKLKTRDGEQEENFRQAVNSKIKSYFIELNIDLEIENEYSLKGGKRIDSLIDKVFFEY